MVAARELHPALLGFNQALSYVSYAAIKMRWRVTAPVT